VCKGYRALKCVVQVGVCVQSQRLKLSESVAAVDAAEAKAAQLEANLAEARRTITGLEEDLLATDQAGQPDASTAQGRSCLIFMPQ